MDCKYATVPSAPGPSFVGIAVQQPAAAPAPAPVIPAVPSPSEFQSIVKNKKVAFNSRRYFNEGWSFSNQNKCALFCSTFIFFVLYITPLLLFAFWAFWDIWNSLGLEWSDFENITSSEDFDEYDWENFAEAHNLTEFDFTRYAHLGFGVTSAVNTIVAIPLLIGFYSAVAAAMRNQSYLSSTHMLRGFQHCRNFTFAIVLQVVISVGYWALFIPGLYLSFATVFAHMIRSEQPTLSSWKTIMLSCRLFNKYFCQMFCFIVLLTLLQFVGYMAFGIGLLFTIPFALVCIVFCYNHIVGINGLPVYLSTAPADGIHPLQIIN